MERTTSFQSQTSEPARQRLVQLFFATYVCRRLQVQMNCSFPSRIRFVVGGWCLFVSISPVTSRLMSLACIFRLILSVQTFRDVKTSCHYRIQYLLPADIVESARVALTLKPSIACGPTGAVQLKIYSSSNTHSSTKSKHLCMDMPRPYRVVCSSRTTELSSSLCLRIAQFHLQSFSFVLRIFSFSELK